MRVSLKVTRQGIYQRGDIVIVNLEPVQGSEQQGLRPCIVVSKLADIKKSRSKPLYVVVPLTHSLALKGSLAPLLKTRDGGLASDSVALIMHVRSIDPNRIFKRVGVLNKEELKIIKQGLSDLFGI